MSNLSLVTCCLLLPLISGITAGTFCPPNSAVVTEDSGCDFCRCCRLTNEEYHVLCRNRSLSRIPSHLPPDVTHLDLRYNPIHRLFNHSFPQLQFLTHLQLGGNVSMHALRWTEAGSFKRLPLLKNLTVSIGLDHVNEFLSSARSLHKLTVYCNGTWMKQNEQKTLFKHLHIRKLVVKNCGIDLNEAVFDSPPMEVVANYQVFQPSNTTKNPSRVILPNSKVDISFHGEPRKYVDLTKVLAKSIKITYVVGNLDVDPDFLRWINETKATVRIAFEATHFVRINMGQHQFESFELTIQEIPRARFRNFTTDLMQSREKIQVRKLEIRAPDKFKDHVCSEDQLRRLVGRGLSKLHLSNFQFSEIKNFDFSITTFECSGCKFYCSDCISPNDDPNLREMLIYSSRSRVVLHLPLLLSTHSELKRLVLSDIHELNVISLVLPNHNNLRELVVYPGKHSYADYDKLDVSKLVNLEKLELKNVAFRDAVMPAEYFRLGNLRKLYRFHFGYVSIHNSITIKGSLHSLFAGLHSLRELEIIKNPFWTDISLVRDLLKPVSKTLVLLDLSGNAITDLPSDLFSDLSQLTTLRLHRNQLGTFDASSLHLNPMLSQIRLDNNKLKIIDSRTVKDLSSMKFLRTIPLTQNRFDCWCETTRLRDWIDHDLGKSLRHFDTHPSDNLISGEVCASPSPAVGTKLCKFVTPPFYVCYIVELITGGVILSFLLIGLVLYQMYYYRYDILFWWAVKRYHKVNKQHDLHPEKEFHGFLSYSSTESALARKIFDELENGPDVRFKIVFDGRDFVPGEMVVDNIVNLIDNSEKVIFLISKQFLSREWTTYELNFAQMRCFSEKRNIIILIFVEKIKIKKLPKKMQTLVRQVTYLELPDESDIRGRKNFWTRLRIALAKDSKLETIHNDVPEVPQNQDDDLTAAESHSCERTPLMNNGLNSGRQASQCVHCGHYWRHKETSVLPPRPATVV